MSEEIKDEINEELNEEKTEEISETVNEENPNEISEVVNEENSEEIPEEEIEDKAEETEEISEAVEEKEEENTEETDSDESVPVSEKPAHPEAAIEAILFAYGNSVSSERLCEVLCLTPEELEAAIKTLEENYASEGRGITITRLEDSYQLGTKADYYDPLIRLAKHPKRYTLSDTVIETLSIIAYKQPVTKAEIERIRGVSSDHAINRLLEYELVEEVGRLDAPGRPLLFGTTEQFLRAFGVSSLSELPEMSEELKEEFREQAIKEASEGDGTDTDDDERVTVEV